MRVIRQSDARGLDQRADTAIAPHVQAKIEHIDNPNNGAYKDGCNDIDCHDIPPKIRLIQAVTQ